MSFAKTSNICYFASIPAGKKLIRKKYPLNVLNYNRLLLDSNVAIVLEEQHILLHLLQLVLHLGLSRLFWNRVR